MGESLNASVRPFPNNTELKTHMENEAPKNEALFKIEFTTNEGDTSSKTLPANQISTEAISLSNKGYYNIRICFIPQ